MTTVATLTAAPLTLASAPTGASKRLHVSFDNNADHCQFSSQTRAPKKIRVDPNNIKATYPDLKLGKDFRAGEPLEPNIPLEWHVKVALAPIDFYHRLTRHNAWVTRQFSKFKNPIGDSLKKGHIPCMFADKGGRLSCSEYTALAIKVMGQRDGVWGSIKGWAYGFWRVMSCNPINLYRYETKGYLPKDPVW